jgi:hypothetical protein
MARQGESNVYPEHAARKVFINPLHAPNCLSFTYPSTESTKLEQFKVTLSKKNDEIHLEWDENSDNPGDLKPELERDALQRFQERFDWIDRANSLMATVSAWSQEIGWATKLLHKKLDDSYIGQHIVCALLIQEGLDRVMFEPIGRSSAEVKGIVDLYLLPAYDDIARLLFIDGRWTISIQFQDDALDLNENPEPAPFPLSKDSLEKVLNGLKVHAR